MEKIIVDFNSVTGKIKPMHAVNNGPIKQTDDQKRDNYLSYKKLALPYARNHDAAFNAGFGGEHSNDITGIFPNFDADPYDPASYDFVLTDEYIERMLSVGTKPFFRLGQKIEHTIKKYGTLPPKDFQKWAVVCEHIIKHFNYGWADGHNYGIEYFEIWNEPDLDDDDSKNKRTWGGTKVQFFELYKTASLHLKKCFPELKIGGPALAGRCDWANDFLSFCNKEKLPLDFFSWHIYGFDPQQFVQKDAEIKNLLVKNGYENAESILNEWNYVKDWSGRFIYSIEVIIGFKGAAFCSDVILREQKASADMLMYYDARPCVFNGLWDFYTMREMKPYYTFKYFSELYKLGSEVKVTCSPALACVAAYGDGKGALMISNFCDDDENETEDEFEISLDSGKFMKAEIFRVSKDDDGSGKEIPLADKITVKAKKNTVILLKLQ